MLIERRKIASDLLDLDYQQKEKDLRAVLAPESGASDAAKVIAGDRLKLLPGQRALDQKDLDRQYQGAGATYLQSLKLDRGQFLEGEQVKLISEFNQGLDDSVKKALHLHGIFGDIIDMAVRQAITKPLAASFFGGDAAGEGGGGGPGGLLSGLAWRVLGQSSASGGMGLVAASPGSVIGKLGAIASGGIDPLAALFSSIPRFASGGGGVLGGAPGIDRNVLSLNGNPIARVGAGELLSVSPNVAASNAKVRAPVISAGDRHYHVNVNAENSVTPAGFAAGLAKQIIAEADRMDAQRQGQTLQAAPAAVARQQVMTG